MKETQIQRCPHCNSSNIGIGYQLGGGGLFADRYAITAAPAVQK